jgi:bifunctional non-homologous end joining protein LigD
MPRQHIFQPRIPTRATKVPAGPDWLHEIKHDGYRLMVPREGKRVRLWTRRGYDSGRTTIRAFSRPPEACARSFVIDGEAVWLDGNGLSDLDGCP